jgi:Eco57I restriction-modification methylase
MADVNDRWLGLMDSAQFSELFIEELGWDRPVSSKFEHIFGAEKYIVSPVANYKGIQVWACPSIPNARIQREIDNSISKISAERLVIFYSESEQNWRWPMARESSGKGIIRLVNHEHIKGQKTLSLLQRLKFIQISLEAEAPSLVDMLLRLRKAFDADQITKSFYREYATYQSSLVKAINGLEDASDKGWYSSLLLNRLMFIYFMQWKGFMDGNQNYLADRLDKITKLKGPNNFYSFFKDFLLPLFHEGLGAGNKIELPEDIASIVGKIPYVNGGIFSEHELEAKNDISIDDSAFAEIFSFFDKYQWHLDSRRTGNPNEINPDVLGYVFEQFVNNKDQGAYYTKEDITDYMTSNSLVVNLMNSIKKECSINLFLPLVQNGDRYIWPSLKHGEDQREVLPKLTDLAEMDKKSNPLVGLPGETNWETLARFRQLEELRTTLSSGQIVDIPSLIALNIDLELLISDIIDGLDTSEDVTKIWNILSSMKIVDPTCGSGAFLFAALNQLEHLYSVLLDVAEMHEKSARNQELTDLLKNVRRHPNRKYFVLKHAAQKNIFGVDLMKEATEIARLRLFLKLISAIDKYEDIEPLPDLEFNIKSGNLLVGMTKSENLVNHIQTIDAMAFVEDIDSQTQLLANLWDNFLISQELGSEKAKNSKKLLSDGTVILRKTLDKLFYETAPISKGVTFEEWKSSTSPFHWFIEFPEVFQNGGFDVIIGNPPYIKRTKVSYDVSGHFTSSCPDIYAMCMERASLIKSDDATFAMIVMSNLVFSKGYLKLREFLSSKFNLRLVSGYAKRPSLLFEGVQVRNAIFIGAPGTKVLYSAPLRRWTKDYRPNLMSSVKYSKVPNNVDESFNWPFITSEPIADVLLGSKGSLLGDVLTKAPEHEIIDGKAKWDVSTGNMAPLFFSGSAYNWISCFKTVPPSVDGDGNPVVSSQLNSIWFKNETLRDIAFTLYVSKWMFAWWAMYGDDFHVTKDNLLSFPIDLATLSDSQISNLQELGEQLDLQMVQKIKWQKITFPDKRVINVGNWDLADCKKIIIDIDRAWTEILGATDFQVDLQIQYNSTVKTSAEDAPDVTED